METTDHDLRWLRPAEPSMRTLERHRQWLMSLAVRPLFAIFGRSRQETIRLQRRAQLRRYLRSRTIEQLDAIVVDPSAPPALQRAARQHRRYRDQITTTTTIRLPAEPQLPVMHRTARLVVETMRQVGVVRDRSGAPRERLYESDAHYKPITTRLAGVEVPRALVQDAARDQVGIKRYLALWAGS